MTVFNLAILFSASAMFVFFLSQAVRLLLKSRQMRRNKPSSSGGTMLSLMLVARA
jgi:hypothetical protein